MTTVGLVTITQTTLTNINKRTTRVGDVLFSRINSTDTHNVTTVNATINVKPDYVIATNVQVPTGQFISGVIFMGQVDIDLDYRATVFDSFGKIAINGNRDRKQQIASNIRSARFHAATCQLAPNSRRFGQIVETSLCNAMVKHQAKKSIHNIQYDLWWYFLTSLKRGQAFLDDRLNRTLPLTWNN